MSVTIHKIANIYIPPLMNAAEILSLIDAYIDKADSNLKKTHQALKEVDELISLGNIDKAIPLLSPDEVFYGLGKEAWKDIIDGKHHARGRLVFDRSRPEHSAEPGFTRA